MKRLDSAIKKLRKDFPPPIRVMICVVLCTMLAVCVRAQDAQVNADGESSTTAKQISVDNTNPVRTTESHYKAGNRSVDKQKVEVLGPNGRYQLDSESEKETVQVDATTSRTVVRTYRLDGNGQRKLAEMTEEQARTSVDGQTQVVRTTSSTDVNGNLEVERREVSDVRETSPDTQETKTTLYLADGNGGFGTSTQTEELQKRSADHKLEVKTTARRPDGNGGWEVNEVTAKTIVEDGKNRTTDERVSRRDSEGRLSEYSRTVGTETETTDGKRISSVEEYSTDGSGVVNDGKLHLNERVTTVQKKDSDGQTTEQQLEMAHLGNPRDSMQVTGRTKYTVLYGAAGTQQTKTIEARDSNGTFKVVGVETQKSEQAPPAREATALSDKPK